MTEMNLIDDLMRLRAEAAKLKAIGAIEHARLVECDVQCIADRLGWK